MYQKPRGVMEVKQLLIIQYVHDFLSSARVIHLCTIISM